MARSFSLFWRAAFFALGLAYAGSQWSAESAFFSAYFDRRPRSPEQWYEVALRAHLAFPWGRELTQTTLMVARVSVARMREAEPR